MIELFKDDRRKLTTCVKINVCVISIGILICILNADFKKIRFGPSDDLYVVGIQVNTISLYIGFALYIITIQISLLFTEEFALPIIEFTVYNPQCEVIERFEELELMVLSIGVFFTKGILKGLKLLLAVESIDSIILLFLAEEIVTVYTVSILLKQKKFITRTQDLSKSDANFIGQIIKSIFLS